MRVFFVQYKFQCGHLGINICRSDPIFSASIFVIPLEFVREQERSEVVYLLIDGADSGVELLVFHLEFVDVIHNYWEFILNWFPLQALFSIIFKLYDSRLF